MRAADLPGRLVSFAVACAVALVLFAPLVAPARADDRIEVSHASVTTRTGADPGTYVEALFDLNLPPSLRDAVDHGIALYFMIDLEISRSRWYWFDKRLVDDSIQYRLSYSPLTRQYRLARGGLALPFDSLDEAMATLRRVSNWRVGDSNLLDGGKPRARIRLRLDTSMLPKPFQVSALTDPDWTMASSWFNLDFVTETEK
jgi:hypothetical protein